MKEKPHNRVPDILRTILFNYESWLIGSSVSYVLNETNKRPKDFDCIIDPSQWQLACRILILHNFEVNSFGGFKVKTEMGDVDFWSQSLSDFIRHSKCKQFLGFNSSLIAFKENDR